MKHDMKHDTNHETRNMKHERKARVAVGGKFSWDMRISNMVYQGTVLGPPLRNTFYSEAAIAVNFYGFLKIMFADDYNCFKDFRLSLENTNLCKT